MTRATKLTARHVRRFIANFASNANAIFALATDPP